MTRSLALTLSVAATLALAAGCNNRGYVRGGQTQDDGVERYEARGASAPRDPYYRGDRGYTTSTRPAPSTRAAPPSGTWQAPAAETYSDPREQSRADLAPTMQWPNEDPAPQPSMASTRPASAARAPEGAYGVSVVGTSSDYAYEPAGDPTVPANEPASSAFAETAYVPAASYVAPEPEYQPTTYTYIDGSAPRGAIVVAASGYGYGYYGYPYYSYGTYGYPYYGYSSCATSHVHGAGCGHTYWNGSWVVSRSNIVVTRPSCGTSVSYYSPACSTTVIARPRRVYVAPRCAPVVAPRCTPTVVAPAPRYSSAPRTSVSIGAGSYGGRSGVSVGVGVRLGGHR